MNKIGKNRKRDKKVQRALHEKGWNVVRIWEHELRADSAGVLRKVLNVWRMAGRLTRGV
jgi:DNA mismatch endonuclease (patch repair protein)